ncbi:hypothetical protein IOCL2690_000565500 [Leishmania lindenbergi]|uniref:Uncharacterized protein n=1 Tax=Leishmania lindenbergi TaxID=651832 RepID=A0AAW3A7Q9_9TRYP
MPTPPNHHPASPPASFAANHAEASVLRQLESHMMGHESLMRAKGRSVAQLERRVRELEDALTAATVASESTEVQ